MQKSCGGKVWIRALILEEEDDSLAGLLPLRAEVSHNDYRLFYLGWLLCIQYGDVSPKSVEPQVPLGLGSLSPALEEFVNFFQLDKALLSAASASAGPQPEICSDDIEPSVSGLSDGQKFQWLCRIALEDNPKPPGRISSIYPSRLWPRILFR